MIVMLYLIQELFRNRLEKIKINTPQMIIPIRITQDNQI